MRRAGLVLLLAGLFFACGASEASPVSSVPPMPPEPAASPVVDAGAADARGESNDAAPEQAPAVSAAQVFRGQLVATYLAYGGLRKPGGLCKPSDDAGVCTAQKEAEAARDIEKRLHHELDEAKTFAAEHAGAPSEPVACLTALTHRVDKLAQALERSRGAAAARTALSAQIKACDDALDRSPAALNRPVRAAPVTSAAVMGHLPPEDIQRIVRQHFGLFRRCYQSGLRRDPTLGGRIETEFIIDFDGSVARARVKASTLPDADVGKCVADSFWSLRFPPPQEGGYVTVVYPLIFSPGG